MAAVVADVRTESVAQPAAAAGLGASGALVAPILAVACLLEASVPREAAWQHRGQACASSAAAPRQADWDAASPVQSAAHPRRLSLALADEASAGRREAGVSVASVAVRVRRRHVGEAERVPMMQAPSAPGSPSASELRSHRGPMSAEADSQVAFVARPGARQATAIGSAQPRQPAISGEPG